jgi:hypothetical protein
MKRESPGGCTNPRTGLWPTFALAATVTEARSSPELSAWLIIRACSQKGVPNTAGRRRLGRINRCAEGVTA